MTSSVKQKSVFMTLLLLSAAASFLGYRLTQGKYIAYHQAENLFLAGEFKSAIPFFKKALELGLKLPAAQRHLGDAYLAVRDPMAAVGPYEIYTRQSPSDFQTLGKLATLYDQLGHEKKALGLLEKALSQDGGRPGLWVALAGLHQRRGAYAPAEKAYLKALELEPGLPAAVFGLAETYAWQKRYGQALGLYRAYLAKRPGDRAARLNLARVLSWKGDFNQAINQYDLVLEEKR